MHVQRLQQETAVAYDRASIIGRVESRFYVDEPTVLVRNGLSTDLLCSASDLFRTSRRQVLTEKVHDAMEYATAFTDVEELNALQYMPPEQPNDYLTLGLYLYLADECSRRCPDQTFLSALRAAKVSLDIDDVPDAQRFFERCQKALKILGMDDAEHMGVLQEWKDTGTYTLHGERNYSDDDGVKGTYAELAANICQRQKYLGMNLAISYALGNKHEVENLSAEEMLADARRAADNTQIVDRRIARGFDIREDQLINCMLEATRSLPPAPDNATSQWAGTRARAILQWLPDNALEVLDRERYICAYADAPVIGTVYPAENPPGIKNEDEKDVRNNKGQWLSRYRTIFMSNGYRQQAGDIDADPTLKSAVAAQTLMHEVMHMAIAALPDEKRKQLKAEVEEFSAQLISQEKLPDYFGQRLRTIDTNTLTEVLNTKSRLYLNYSNKWEEVACNAYGLMHSEFNAKGSLSSERPFQNPPKGLESLTLLAQHLDNVMDEALVHFRSNPTPNWGMDRLLHDRLGVN
jgi:hypothetical protein